LDMHGLVSETSSAPGALRSRVLGRTFGAASSLRT
jgi:hypothetical protein